MMFDMEMGYRGYEGGEQRLTYGKCTAIEGYIDMVAEGGPGECDQ